MSRAWVVLVCAAPAFCQGFRLGVKAGVPVTEYFETGASGSLHGDAHYSAATRRYTLGAGLEWYPAKFGLELDALFHRMGYVAYVSTFNSATGAYSDSAVDVKGNSWDFPLLIRRRFGPMSVGGGGVIRRVGPVRGRGEETVGSLVTRTSSTSTIDTTEPSELRKRWYPGVTAAAAFEFRAGRVRITPEWRYTRWTANISSPGGLLRFASNQVEFLAGFSF